MRPAADDGEILARNAPGLAAALAGAAVGVAGCGGLGSNAAVALVRGGVGRLVLVDADAVEPSNLNRQHYFQADLGAPKVEALARHLRAIRPGVDLALHRTTLTPALVPALFSGADLLLEAFDRAEAKRWLIEAWVRAFPGRPIVCGSGVAGVGRTGALRVRQAGSIFVCGDEETDPSAGLCSARVGLVACMQANVAMEWLLARAAAGGNRC